MGASRAVGGRRPAVFLHRRLLEVENEAGDMLERSAWNSFAASHVDLERCSQNIERGLAFRGCRAIDDATMMAVRVG